jgi:hypothetical protein
MLPRPVTKYRIHPTLLLLSTHENLASPTTTPTKRKKSKGKSPPADEQPTPPQTPEPPQDESKKQGEPPKKQDESKKPDESKKQDAPEKQADPKKQDEPKKQYEPKMADTLKGYYKFCSRNCNGY